MRIGIDCRLWNETGIGRYIRNIVNNIASMDKKNEYVLFVLSNDYDDIKLPPNFTKVVTDIRWHSFKEQLIFPYYVYREKLDLFFVPNLNIPILYFKKMVITVHDLTVTKVKTGRASTLPTYLYYMKRFAARAILWIGIHRAKTIFTVSNYVKKEILVTYKIKKSKLRLTPCAVSDKFFNHVNSQENQEILSKYGVNKPYIFYVGNAHPHKNIERLIEAFEIVAQQNNDLELVLGGSKKFFYERIENEISTKAISRKIKFIGFVADDDLPVLYSEAEATVNPSLYEGFGIQILESFACGTKVVCSNTTSLPEVGGNIAYYFNPKDVKNMAEAILSCVKDNNQNRIQSGYTRCKDFSWSKSAETVLSVFKKV